MVVQMLRYIKLYDLNLYLYCLKCLYNTNNQLYLQIGWLNKKPVNIKPEFDQLVEASRKFSVPLKLIQREVVSESNRLKFDF